MVLGTAHGHPRPDASYKERRKDRNASEKKKRKKERKEEEKRVEIVRTYVVCYVSEGLYRPGLIGQPGLMGCEMILHTPGRMVCRCRTRVSRFSPCNLCRV
jgi:hypothetical protein